MRLAYNFDKQDWEVFPETTPKERILSEFIRNKNGSEDDLIAIFEIDHWTKDNIIDFEDLPFEDQELVLDRLTAVLTTEK